MFNVSSSIVSPKSLVYITPNSCIVPLSGHGQLPKPAPPAEFVIFCPHVWVFIGPFVIKHPYWPQIPNEKFRYLFALYLVFSYNFNANWVDYIV